jgi:hypothetical protein
MIEPADKDRRSRKWKRWERANAMELWQLDLVGGFPLADGTSVKALTGVDDHSRFCVSARLMARERTRPVCDAFALAMRTWGVPQQVLTDNGKVFTGRFHHPPVEVLFDQICRENGIEHLLTQPRSPTTTGKIERFHRTLRAEFLPGAGPFKNLTTAQTALDEWVSDYNQQRPHRALDMATPAERFTAAPTEVVVEPAPDRTGGEWVSRRVGANGVVTVAWQQVSVGLHRGGARCDVHVDGDILRFWIGNELVKTAARTNNKEVRKKNASVPGTRA